MRFLQILAFMAVMVCGAQALAQDTPPMQPLPEAAMADDAPIKLTPDGPAVIKLNEDAASVVIGNPQHASALLENPRLLMLVPQLPGATKIIALNKDGKAILNKHVLVSSGNSSYKRITRACALSQNGTCAPVSMYYCPGKCYETALPDSTTVQAGATGTLSNLPTDSAAPPAEGNDDLSVQTNDMTSVLQ
ncbi:MAG: pilus assembly protein N-terminal domain-containing protein [Alphaproteobacteria bacterium]|nr:pilus assembly protein N-terminal domain-containing protein [Alphaproteobacteria bacterium]